MKSLTLIRHAKSSWKDPTLRDFDRPLNKRGYRNAPFMGQLLNEKGVKFDRVYSSPARRAIDTAKYICAEIDYDLNEIETDPNLYHADADDLLNFIGALDDGLNDVALVGHNPALTDLTNLLGTEPVDNVPTSGIVFFKVDIERWQDIVKDKASLLSFEYPKKYV